MADYEILETSLKTFLQYSMPSNIKKAYKNMSFGTEPATTSQGFPNVYVHQLESPERDSDIEHRTIKNVRAGFQIEVADNDKKEIARTVAYAVVDLMKQKGFDVMTMPVYSKVNNVHVYVSRFRRDIFSDQMF